MTIHYRFLLITICCCLCLVYEPGLLYAQKRTPHDSSYFATYPGMLTTRFFFSQKYTTFILPASGNVEKLQYRPNTKLNMGIGATYKNLTLNIAYGFDFLNDADEQEKTKSLDLQMHLYPDKWVIDVLGIFHSGLVLYTGDYLPMDSANYVYRPDVKQNFVGLSAFHVLNNKRFSYNAVMIQNEWQKKSAGSILLGGQAFYGQIKADSALAKKQMDNGNPSPSVINKINFYSVGPGAGYAYTFVVMKHFFVTGSAIGSLNLNISAESGTNVEKNRIALNPGAIYKAAIGFNNNSWGISANWAGSSLWVNSASSDKDFFINTGNYRLIFTKKIPLKMN